MTCTLRTVHGELPPASSVLHPAFAHAPQPLSVPLSPTYPADKPFVRACLFLRARVWPGLVNELALGIHELIWLSAVDRSPCTRVRVCLCLPSSLGGKMRAFCLAFIQFAFVPQPDNFFSILMLARCHCRSFCQ